MADLSVSIVSYNVRELLKACLASVYADAGGLSLEVFVVDNGSVDGTADMVKADFPQVRLILAGENQGYARANNEAIAASTAEFVLVLNPDTVLLPGALKALLGFMKENPGAGICGPKIHNPDMTLQNSGERCPTFLYGLFRLLFLNALFPGNPVRAGVLYSGWDRNSVREVDALNGACLLARREAIADAGPMDGNFLLYFEEVDWCRRVGAAGWKVVFFPGAGIIHYGGRSTGQSGREWVAKVFNDSFLYYYRKHFGWPVHLLFRAVLYGFTLPATRLWRLLSRK